jgi:hypothetical protein
LQGIWHTDYFTGFSHSAASSLTKQRRNRQFWKITKSMAKVVQNLRDYFETEKVRRQRIGIGKVVERAKNATRVGVQTIVAIGKCKDLDMWAFEADEEENREREMQVPMRYVAVVRQALRFFFLERGNFQPFRRCMTS